MKNRTDTLLPLVKKLQLWARLTDDEEQAVLAMPHTVADLLASKLITREGDTPSQACLLMEGFAFRYKVLSNGSRSISALHMRGDVVDLQNSVFGTADHGVQTLTRCKVAFIPREEILRLAFAVPNVGRAMWFDSFVEASIFREWIANVGRRDATERLSHLLCEFGLRREAIGLGDRGSYELPMTQEQLADATGLTQVHVNRMLKGLETRGLITRAKKSISVADWKQLAVQAGFTGTYLHLEEGRTV